MMTTDIKKPQPKTVQELKDKNFTLYVLDDLNTNKIAIINLAIEESRR